MSYHACLFKMSISKLSLIDPFWLLNCLFLSIVILSECPFQNRDCKGSVLHPHFLAFFLPNWSGLIMPSHSLIAKHRFSLRNFSQDGTEYFVWLPFIPARCSIW